MKNDKKNLIQTSLLILGVGLSLMIGGYLFSGIFLSNADSLQIPDKSNETLVIQDNLEQNTYSSDKKEENRSIKNESNIASKIFEEDVFPPAEKEDALGFVNSENYLDQSGNIRLPLFVSQTVPTNNHQDISLNSEIRITLSRSISRNLILPKIEPETVGNWYYEDPVPGEYLYRTLVFMPDQILNPETEYKILLNGTNELNKINQSFSYVLNFKTKSLPKIISAEMDYNTDPPQAIVRLSDQNIDFVDFDFNFDPTLEFDVELNNAKNEYKLKIHDDFKKGVQYKLYVGSELLIRDKVTQGISLQSEANPLFETSFKIAAPAEIVEFEPQGSQVLIHDGIRIVFVEPMQKDSVQNAFSISPDLEGGFYWPNDSEVIFHPYDAMKINTDYTVNLQKEVRNMFSEEMSDDLNFSFRTLSKLRITSFYPRNNSSNNSVTPTIKFYFDKPVDQELVQSKFKISPNASGSFSFPNSTTMAFKPNKLSYKKTYRVTLSAGVRSTYDANPNFQIAPISGSRDDYVLYSDKKTFRFATKGKTVKLGVPMDYQDKPLSCEAASLKMALRYKGKAVSENSIMNRISTDSRLRRGNNIWGDPYNFFVGNIYGRQNSTGYGVYWRPIETAARVWRGGSRDFSNWSINRLTNEINKGNPVVVWGTLGSYARQDSWRTTGGKHIPAWVGEHARTVVGFVNGPNSPSKIIVHDPIAGVIYWNTSSFRNNWNRFGKAGVAVR